MTIHIQVIRNIHSIVIRILPVISDKHCLKATAQCSVHQIVVIRNSVKPSVAIIKVFYYTRIIN